MKRAAYAKHLLAVLSAIVVCQGAVAGPPRDNAYCETYVQYVPGAVYLFGSFAGAQCRTDFIDRASKTVVTYVIDFLFVQGLKRLADENRPDGSDLHSFPSGHTSTAFAAAELVRQDYGAAPAAVAYCAGAYTGTMRVVHRRHWWWDAVAGAAVGTGSALIANALQPVIREHIIDPVFSAMGIRTNKSQSLVIIPSGPDFKGASLVFAMEF